MAEKYKIVKVKRSTGRFNKDNYNLHVYKTKPNSRWWSVYDACRNMDQAKSVVTSQPPGCAIIVATPDYKPEFPYHIYTNERLLQERYKEIRSGVRFR